MGGGCRGGEIEDAMPDPDEWNPNTIGAANSLSGFNLNQSNGKAACGRRRLIRSRGISARIARLIRINAAKVDLSLIAMVRFTRWARAPG